MQVPRTDRQQARHAAVIEATMELAAEGGYDFVAEALFGELGVDGFFLEYDDAGRAAGLPPSVFCKATHDLLTRVFLGSTGSIVSETTFYNRVRPLLAIEAPRPGWRIEGAFLFNGRVAGGLPQRKTKRPG